MSTCAGALLTIGTDYGQRMAKPRHFFADVTRRAVPCVLERRDALAYHEDQVKRSIACNRVSDVDIAALGVPSLWRVHYRKSRRPASWRQVLAPVCIER